MCGTEQAPGLGKPQMLRSFIDAVTDVYYDPLIIAFCLSNSGGITELLRWKWLRKSVFQNAQY